MLYFYIFMYYCSLDTKGISHLKTISFAISVGPSFCISIRVEKHDLQWTDFHKIWYQLSLCTLLSYVWRGEVQVLSVLNLSLDRGKWSASRPGLLILGRNVVSQHCISGWEERILTIILFDHYLCIYLQHNAGHILWAFADYDPSRVATGHTRQVIVRTRPQHRTLLE
jgi:hypothetical protein